MEIVMLHRDGRCKWLENKVLNGILPDVVKMAANPFAKKLFVIVDWISNDKGRVGVDLKWFRSLGVPAVESYRDLPESGDYKVINTGYDSIVNEEHILNAAGVEIIDKPCPFIRKVRNIMEEADPEYQYVYLCEDNHITVKNFESVFPDDMIMVQMDNYEARIEQQQNGKPLRLIPYVTFLHDHANQIFEYIQQAYPDRVHDKLQTSCLWIHSKASPIIEIDQLTEEELDGISDALLVTTQGSTNKSLISLEESLQKRGLHVVQIGSFLQFLSYQRKHRNDKVLLVKSPIPNKAELPILAYIDHGIFAALRALVRQSKWYRQCSIGLLTKALYVKNLIFRAQARKQAEEAGLAK